MLAWARFSRNSGTLTLGLPFTAAVSTPWCTLMTKSLTAICLPAGTSANRIPPLCQMVPVSFPAFSQPPVTGKANRTATPPSPICAPSVPGSVAIGTIPLPSRAVAIPGAVVTVVSPPVSRTWADRVAVDADAELAAATGPATRPAMVAMIATRLNMRISTPFNIAAALGRGSPDGIRAGGPRRMQSGPSSRRGGEQGSADHAVLGVLGAPVERLQRDVDARGIPQVHSG